MSEQNRAGFFWRDLKQLSKSLNRFLSPAHKRRLATVSLWACSVSLLEMCVAAAAVPYVRCLGGQCPAPVTSAALWLGWPTVPTASLALFLLIAVKLFVQARFNWSVSGFHQSVQRETVNRLFDAYLHLDWMGFRSRHRTHYFRRCATTAVDAALVGYQCITLISSALMLLFLAGLMLWQYPRASLILGAGFTALSVATLRLTGRAQKVVARRREAALQRWNTGMAEAYHSFREIRVHGLEQFFQNHLNHSIEELELAGRKLGFLPTLPRLVLDFAIFATLGAVVSYWLVTQRPLADLVPQLVFYAVVARAILPAMMNLLATRSALYGTTINIELVLTELERSAERRLARVGIKPAPAGAPAFVFDNVSFAYAPELPPVLSGASMKIAHPSWVAIAGPSGAGKSTLMELLCGLLQPLDGQVIHRWPASAEDRGAGPKIAYLPQHVALLDGSVMENVVFGFDAGDRDRIDEVLRLACLDKVVEALPGGLDAHIGADGGTLSGGERQRLALARALYRSPDLLLLDEATSGLDEETETRLLSNLRRARPATTVVFVSHRPGNLQFADRIFYLQNGVLSEAAASSTQGGFAE